MDNRKKLVPVWEPTAEMIEAARQRLDDLGVFLGPRHIKSVYRMMIAAAPAEEPTSVEQTGDQK